MAEIDAVRSRPSAPITAATKTAPAETEAANPTNQLGAVKAIVRTLAGSEPKTAAGTSQQQVPAAPPNPAALLRGNALESAVLRLTLLAETAEGILQLKKDEWLAALLPKSKPGSQFRQLAGELLDTNFRPDLYRPETMSFALLALGYHPHLTGAQHLSPQAIDDLANAALPNAELRTKVFEALLSHAEPTAPPDQPATEGSFWLSRQQGVPLVTQKEFGVHYLEEWATADKEMRKLFGSKTLEELGLLDAQGTLRFAQHRLLLPFWLPADDDLLPVHVLGLDIQSGAPEPPVEYLSAPTPCLYNMRAILRAHELGTPLLICADALTAQTLSHAQCQAVAVAGPEGFLPEWTCHFDGLAVFLAIPNDAEHKALCKTIVDAFRAAPLPTPRQFKIPPEQTLVEFFSTLVGRAPGASVDVMG